MTRSQVQQRDLLLRWAEAYPPPVSFLALLAAKSAEPVHLATDWAINGYPIKLPVTTYDEPKFREYYAYPHRLAAELLHWCDEEGSTTLSQIERVLDSLPKLTKRWVREAFRKATWSEVTKGLRVGNRCWRRALYRLVTWMVLPNGDEELDAESLSLMDHPATAFLVQIAVPHWILFGRWPQESFRLASRVDRYNRRDIKQLVLLDPRVIHHPGLRPVLHPASTVLRRSRQKEIGKAYGSRPSTPTLEQVKRRLASFISCVSERFMSKRIKPSAINRLFDLVAGTPRPITDDFRGDVALDPDLPREDLLRDAIKHYGKQWSLPPKPEKEYFLALRTLGQFAA